MYDLFADGQVIGNGAHKLWQGKTKRGKPVTRSGNDARQYAWEHLHPKGYILPPDVSLVECDTFDSCVNPEHLYPVARPRRPATRALPHAIYNRFKDHWESSYVCGPRVKPLDTHETEQDALQWATDMAKHHLSGREGCHKGYTRSTDGKVRP